MPLSPSGLSAVIESELNSSQGPPTDESKQKNFADALAKAIVNYLVANTVVNAGQVVVTVGGPTTQTGATTTPGTII